MKFDKVSTGNTPLDEVINLLRIGDNVVFQVDRIEDYQLYVNDFVSQSLRDNRKMIYIRFGSHPALLEPQEGITLYPLDPSVGFENFTITLHQIIADEGLEAFYVFDSLSTLLESWATDLMIGNFFQVTCPYLFEMDTIAFFALIRGQHDFETIARIRETTQLLLDHYYIEGHGYLHPLKVWNRYAPTMFLPHEVTEDAILPITSSAQAASLFQYLPKKGFGDVQRHLDYWDKLFLDAEQHADIPDTQILSHLCQLMLTKEPKMLSLCMQYFKLDDLLSIKSRLVGSGYIGGKAVGMLLARQVLHLDPQLLETVSLEPHDSFYIGSDIFYTYLVQNGWWHLRLMQRNPDSYYEAAKTLYNAIMTGTFSDGIKEQFKQILEYYGQSPIIVRSSSLLEDSFGNAFSGKYDSVFCANQGSPTERYQAFESAVKTVYQSAMSKDALAYRKLRGLDQKDEQMAILVQRVSGDYHHDYFCPFLAGVAFSYNNYVWHQSLDPGAGMMRLVLGLGTKAVDRVAADHPRVVALDHPTLQPFGNTEEKKRYTQHGVDVIHLSHNAFETIDLYHFMYHKPNLPMNLIGTIDYETNEKIRALKIKEQLAFNLTYDQLFKTSDFVSTIRQLLETLSDAYGHPVDIEFTVNTDANDKLTYQVVQCRPLQTKGEKNQVIVPTLPESSLCFKTQGHFMGGSMDMKIDRVLYVEPQAYGELSERDKYALAKTIGKLNQIFYAQNSITMLIAPGRIGSSTPSLGVPLSFSDICHMTVLCETAYPLMGMTPDLSFGSHFFQDLVENDMFYVAIFPEEKTTYYKSDCFHHYPNQLGQYLPDAMAFESVLRVLEPTELKLVAATESQTLVCFHDL